MRGSTLHSVLFLMVVLIFSCVSSFLVENWTLRVARTEQSSYLLMNELLLLGARGAGLVRVEPNLGLPVASDYPDVGLCQVWVLVCQRIFLNILSSPTF